MAEGFPQTVALGPIPAATSQSRFISRAFAGLVRRFSLGPALLLLVVAALARAHGTVDSDVAWQLWVARHLQSGAVLYRDIFETNPPLWFWIGVPIDWLAAFLHVRPEAALVGATAALTALSVTALNALLDHDFAPYRRSALLTASAAAMFLIPWTDAGQREQLVLIGAIPYAALIAARRVGRTVSWQWALSVGAGAGLGFALKHYFLLVPAFLELWLAAVQGRRWRPLRAETLAMAAVGATYGIAMLLWAPGFFTTVLPMLRLAYGATGATAIHYLFQPALIVALLTLAVTATQIRSLLSSSASLAAALFIAAAGFLAAYFLQSKGWPYHAIPIAGTALLSFAALLTPKTPVWVKLAAPALLALPFGVSLDFAVRAADYSNHELEAAVAGLRPGESVGFIAEDSAGPWSVTLQHDLRYSSRYNGFWMLRAVAANERKAHPDPRLAALGHEVVEQTIADFHCIPPRRIIVIRPPADLDPAALFLRDRRFAALISHYHPMGGPGPVQVLELSAKVQPLSDAGCRTGV